MKKKKTKPKINKTNLKGHSELNGILHYDVYVTRL